MLGRPGRPSFLLMSLSFSFMPCARGDERGQGPLRQSQAVESPPSPPSIGSRWTMPPRQGQTALAQTGAISHTAGGPERAARWPVAAPRDRSPCTVMHPCTGWPGSPAAPPRAPPRRSSRAHPWQRWSASWTAPAGGSTGRLGPLGWLRQDQTGTLPSCARAWQRQPPPGPRGQAGVRVGGWVAGSPMAGGTPRGLHPWRQL
jgi:hypothetical protein